MNNPKITTIKPEPFYSSHIFIFPFEWKHAGSEKALFEKQADLRDLELLMKNSDPAWERRQSWLPAQSLVQYNEVNYFYNFVRPVLYDTGDNETLQCHYYLRLPFGTEYVIEMGEGDKNYHLEVDDVVLSFYSMGVGLMAFHLLNRSAEQAAPEDILKINEFGRRLFPASYRSNASWLGEQRFFEDADWARGLSGTQSSLLAHGLYLQAGTQRWGDDFRQWKEKPEFDVLPGLISALLPEHLPEKLGMQPVLDDRMFVVCWYGNDQLVEEMRYSRPDGHLYNDWWYEFVFVDGTGKTCQNSAMAAELLSTATNTRWTDYGTYFGVSRYSLVCLTQNFSTEFFNRVICSHIQTIYYKIALLCLVQRSSMLRFSKEVTAISRLNDRERRIGDRVGSLYKQYTRFINKIYFREVTAQDQGIELYDLLQQQMRLDTHVKELENEIRELHNYVLILEENQRSEKLDILTYIGAFFVVPSFIVSFVDLSFFEKLNPQHIAMLCISSAILAYLVIRTSGRWRWIFVLLFALLMAFTVLYFPHLT